MFFHHLAVPIALAASALAGNVQKANLQLPANAAANRDAVKQAFIDAYDVYRKFAFGHDDLEPVSLSFDDSRNGWGASIVDGMRYAISLQCSLSFAYALPHSSTMLVMGLTVSYPCIVSLSHEEAKFIQDFYDQAVQFAATIDFNQSNVPSETVSYVYSSLYVRVFLL